jgi:hypothetical protein
VTPAGGKLLRYRYEVAGGRERTLAIGAYPTVSLADARGARDAARALLHKGQDPSTEKRTDRANAAADAVSTFEVVAREWHEKSKGRWLPRHATDVLRWLEAFAVGVAGAGAWLGVVLAMDVYSRFYVDLPGTQSLLPSPSVYLTALAIRIIAAVASPMALLTHVMMRAIDVPNLFHYLTIGTVCRLFGGRLQMKECQPTEIGPRNPEWDKCTRWRWEESIVFNVVPCIGAMLMFWLVARPHRNLAKRFCG